MIEDVFSAINQQQVNQAPISALDLFSMTTPDFSDLPGVQLMNESTQELEEQRQVPLIQDTFKNEQELLDANIEGTEGFSAFDSAPIDISNVAPRGGGGGGGGSVTAQVTRYGYVGDPYQNKKATLDGSEHENIGNRGNILEDGVSVALSPEIAKKLGVDLKKGDYVEANLGGKWQRFRVDDTTAKGLKNGRIDFYDPSGKRKKIDGSKIQIRKEGAGGGNTSNYKSSLGFSSSAERRRVTAAGGVALLKDSNKAKGVKVTSPLVVIPDNAPAWQRKEAQRVVDEIAAWQSKDKGRAIKGRVVSRSKNGRGRSNATHTEYHGVEDKTFIDYFYGTPEGRQKQKEWDSRLMGGNSNSKVFLPHSSKDPGAISDSYGWSEVDLAKRLYGS